MNTATLALEKTISALLLRDRRAARLRDTEVPARARPCGLPTPGICPVGDSPASVSARLGMQPSTPARPRLPYLPGLSSVVGNLNSQRALARVE